MKTFWMVMVATLLSTAAFADTNCVGSGDRRYCVGKSGFTAWYETSRGNIYSPQAKKNYYRSGDTLSGDDGSVRTQRNGRVVTNKPGVYDENDVIVDGLFDDGRLFDD